MKKNNKNFDTIKSLDEIMDAEISAKSKGGNTEVKVEGTKYGLMGLLSILVDGLVERTNLTEDDIRKAVDDGLKSEEELNEEIKQGLERLLGKLKNIIEEE